MKKKNKKNKKSRKRYFALGVILLLTVGIFGVMFALDENGKGLGIFDKKDAETNPGKISNVQGENSNTQTNPDLNPGVSGTRVKNTASNAGTPNTESCPGPDLNPEEVEKVRQGILGSDFVKDLPKNGVISLTFFTFCNGNRIIQNNFLIGKNEILDSGNPDIYLTVHSKYISQFNGNNLCEVIVNANNNGDLGVYSDLSDAKLLFKYSGLMKYRDCFGF
jgi:hypothetical protein